MLGGLLAHVDDALAACGDQALVHATVERLLAGGAGAGRQRAVLAARGSLEAVVADLAERTDASALDPPVLRSEA